MADDSEQEHPIIQMLLAAPRVIKRIEERIDGMLASFAPTQRKINSHFDKIYNTRSVRDALIDAGWLPHWRIPEEALSPGADVSKVINEWAMTDWPDCASALLNDLESYKLPESTKIALATAIDLHGSGKYNLVPRVLFPEIEQCARQLIYSKKGMSGRQVHVQLKELTDDMEPLWVLAAMSSIFVPRRALAGAHMPVIKNFIYARALRGQSAPFHPAFPNRNLVLHGEAAYNTPQASINMMFAADIMFRGISMGHHQPHLALFAKILLVSPKLPPSGDLPQLPGPKP